MVLLKKYFTNLITVIFLCACSSQNITKVDSQKSHWDFDHQLQYRQTSLGEKLYRLEVLRNESSDFSNMSVFLVRHSFSMCGHYGFKIKVIQGVEIFTDSMVNRNQILRSLLADVEC